MINDRNQLYICLPPNTRSYTHIQSAVSLHLQAFKPSSHVCSKFESPFLPHFRNQEPPRAQQVRSPALLVTQLEHVIEAGGVGSAAVVAAAVQIWAFVKTKSLKKGYKNRKQSSPATTNRDQCSPYPLTHGIIHFFFNQP